MLGRKFHKSSLSEKALHTCLALLLSLAFLPPAKIQAADTEDPVAAMKAAEKEFKQAEGDFTTLSKGNGSQKTATRAWSDMSGQSSSSSSGAAVTPRSMSDSLNPALHGSPETGYAGTWTDPATGDIITSVIAPTPRPNGYSQNYPIIIEPNVGNWNGYGSSGVIWDGNNPQWPTTPDNPGWGGNSGMVPPPPPPMMPGMGMPGQNFYPSPQLPPNFHPGYRPLYPNPGSRPPAGSGPGWNNGPVPGWNPGWNQGNQPGWNPGGNPGWNPGNNPGWNPGNNPNQGWNQGGNPGWNPGSNPGWNPGGNPGWNPGNNPANNPGWNPGGNPGWNHGNRPGWKPGGNSWGRNGHGAVGGRPWRGNP